MKKLLTLLLISILILSVTVSFTSCDDLAGIINGGGNGTGDNSGDNNGDDVGGDTEDVTGDSTGDNTGDTGNTDDDFEFSDDSASGTGGIHLPNIPAPPAATDPENGGESAEN